MNEPEPLTIWRHVKTNGLYIVICVATCSTNGPEEDIAKAVVYQSMKYKKPRYRSLEEFMDGRFEPYNL